MNKQKIIDEGFNASFSVGGKDKNPYEENSEEFKCFEEGKKEACKYINLGDDFSFLEG